MNNIYIKYFLFSFRQHKVAILLSIFVGALYVFPHIFFMLDLGENYKGIYMSRSYDEDTYYSSIRQIYDGHSPTDDPYIIENDEKTIVSNYKFIEYALGYTGKFLNLEISTLAIVSKFIFPIAIFLAIYFFVFMMTTGVLSSNFTAIFVLLGQELAPLNIHSAINTFLFNSPFESFLFFNRPINPQVSFIFFVVGMLLLYKVWNDSKSKKYSMVVGAFIGFLSYIYFYFWNFTMILSGLIFLYSILKKKKDLLSNILITISSSILIALPFVLNTLHSLGTDTLSISKNYIKTHRFINETVIILPLLIFIIIYIWNYLINRGYINYHRVFSNLNEKTLTFLFLVILSGFIASNQQVVHGYEVQQHHYHFMTNIPVFIITISILFVSFVKKYLGRFALTIVIFSGLVISIHGTSVQASSYQFWKPYFLHYQSYEPVFFWLNKNSNIDDVVYSNITISEIIPIYTHNSVYTSLHASVYPVPTERLAHNYFTKMYLRGVDANNVKDYLYDDTNRNEFGQLVFEGQYWRAMCGSFGCFPDSTLDIYIEDYKNFIKNSFETNLKKYKIDYFVWDKKVNPEWNLQKYSFLETIISTENIDLFRVI